MFGWFGEVGGTRKNHTPYASMCVEFLLFGREKSQENHQNQFLVFYTCNSSPILLFVPETQNPTFLGKSKKMRAGK